MKVFEGNNIIFGDRYHDPEAEISVGDIIRTIEASIDGEYSQYGIVQNIITDKMNAWPKAHILWFECTSFERRMNHSYFSFSTYGKTWIKASS